MAGIRQESDFRCTIVRQTAWGTPVTSTIVGLNTEDMQIMLEGDRHIVGVDRGIRVNHEDDRFVDTASSIPTVKFSCPITSGMLKTVLPGLLQTGTTDWAPTSSVYTMYPTTPDLLPAPRAGASAPDGYFFTIERQSPTAGITERISDCICKSLKLSLHPTNNGGLLWGEWEFFGTTFTKTATAGTGITQDSLAATLRYTWGNLTSVKLDGGATLLSDFQSFETSLTYGAKLAGDTPRGEVLFPRFEGTLNTAFGQQPIGTTIIYDLQADMRSQAISTGKALAFHWGDGTPSSVGELSLTFFGSVEKFDDSDRKEGEVHNVTFTLEQGSSVSAEPAVKFVFYAA